jgi:hypothetical protein
MAESLRADRRHRIELRIEPRTGPFGQSVTTIRRGNDVTVDHTGPDGQLRRFHAVLAPGVHERILDALKQARFPETPPGKIGADGFRVVSTIHEGHELRTRPMPFRTDDAGWAEAFALLDAVISLTSRGLAAADTLGQMLVSGAAERALFAPSAEADEPPLGEDANDVVAAAWSIATEHKHPEVLPLHLLAAFARTHGYHFRRLGIDPERVGTQAESLFSWDPEPSETVSTPSFELCAQVARRIAADESAHEATLRHLLRAMLEAGGKDVSGILQKNRLPDALLAGKTRDRIFSVPAPADQGACARCGAPSGQARWCTRCGRALAEVNSFRTGGRLESVLPSIQPHDFASRSTAACRALATPEQTGVPWLAFRREEGEESELVSADALSELAVGLAELERHARTNLARVPASWTPRWVPGADGREIDVLFCNDEENACERILEKAFLVHAAGLLGATALAAAVPRRGMLLVTRIQDLSVLMALARHYFDTAESDPITPWGFAIQDGEITGPISSPA